MALIVKKWNGNWLRAPSGLLALGDNCCCDICCKDVPCNEEISYIDPALGECVSPAFNLRFINHNCPGLFSGSAKLYATGQACEEWEDIGIPYIDECLGLEAIVRWEPLSGWLLWLKQNDNLGICDLSPNDIWLGPKSVQCNPFKLIFGEYMIESLEPPPGECPCECIEFDAEITADPIATTTTSS